MKRANANVPTKIIILNANAALLLPHSLCFVWFCVKSDSECNSLAVLAMKERDLEWNSMDGFFIVLHILSIFPVLNFQRSNLEILRKFLHDTSTDSHWTAQSPLYFAMFLNIWTIPVYMYAFILYQLPSKKKFDGKSIVATKTASFVSS